jgi:hypothetical protein
VDSDSTGSPKDVTLSAHGVNQLVAVSLQLLAEAAYVGVQDVAFGRSVPPDISEKVALGNNVALMAQ